MGAIGTQGRTRGEEKFSDLLEGSHRPDHEKH